MSMSILQALLLSLCVLSVLTEDPPAASSDVIDLTQADFEEKTKEGFWLVEFYAPWCGHCKRLAPIYEHLGTALKGKFNIARIDCPANGDVCSRSGVTGYPTIKLLENGQEKERYAGPRTASAITSFLKEKANLDRSIEVADLPQQAAQHHPPPQKQVQEEGPSDVTILTESDFATKIAEGFWFVKFYAPWCGHCKSLAPTWSHLATELKGQANIAKIDCTVHRTTCGEHEVKGFPTLLLFKDGKLVEKYNGPRQANDFVNFMKRHGMIGMDVSVKPLSEAPPAQAPPAQKKEQPPAEVDNKPTNVVILTGDNFEESTKQGAWLIKFYAPWCGHCKKLAPTWDSLATQVNLVANTPIKIAKVDCTQHAALCSTHGVRGYPTLKFFVDGKFDSDYRGGRELSHFTDFIASKNLLPQAPLEAATEPRHAEL